MGQQGPCQWAQGSSSSTGDSTNQDGVRGEENSQVWPWGKEARSDGTTGPMPVVAGAGAALGRGGKVRWDNRPYSCKGKESSLILTQQGYCGYDPLSTGRRKAVAAAARLDVSSEGTPAPNQILRKVPQHPINTSQPRQTAHLRVQRDDAEAARQDLPENAPGPPHPQYLYTGQSTRKPCRGGAELGLSNVLSLQTTFTHLCVQKDNAEAVPAAARQDLARKGPPAPKQVRQCSFPSDFHAPVRPERQC